MGQKWPSVYVSVCKCSTHQSAVWKNKPCLNLEYHTISGKLYKTRAIKKSGFKCLIWFQFLGVSGCLRFRTSYKSANCTRVQTREPNCSNKVGGMFCALETDSQDVHWSKAISTTETWLKPQEKVSTRSIQWGNQIQLHVNLNCKNIANSLNSESQFLAGFRGVCVHINLCRGDIGIL